MRGARTFKKETLSARERPLKGKMRRNEEDFTHESLFSLSQMVQSAAGVRIRPPRLAAAHAFQRSLPL